MGEVRSEDKKDQIMTMKILDKDDYTTILQAKYLKMTRCI